MVTTRLVVNDSIESRIVTVQKKKFGDSKPSAKPEQCGNNSESTAAAKPSSANTEMVGSIRTDTSAVYADELDTLFGDYSGTNSDSTNNQLSAAAIARSIKPERAPTYEDGYGDN